MNLPTVKEYQAQPQNELRSDIGFAVWVLFVTKAFAASCPPGFRKEWKAFLETKIKAQPIHVPEK